MLLHDHKACSFIFKVTAFHNSIRSFFCCRKGDWPTPTWNLSIFNWNHRKKFIPPQKKIIPKIIPHPIFLCIFWMLSMDFFPISTPCKVTHHIPWKGTILKRTWNIFQASLFRDIAATLAAKKTKKLRGYDIAQVREHDHLEPLGPWKRMGKVEKVEVAIVFTKNLGCIFFLCCKMARIFWVWFFVLRIWKKHSYCSYNPRELSLKPGISSTCFDLPLLAP